ncbi:MAG: hypothetical protein ACM31L_03070 [Actinomycetota bacterium]
MVLLGLLLLAAPSARADDCFTIFGFATGVRFAGIQGLCTQPTGIPERAVCTRNNEKVAVLLAGADRIVVALEARFGIFERLVEGGDSLTRLRDKCGGLDERRTVSGMEWRQGKRRATATVLSRSDEVDVNGPGPYVLTYRVDNDDAVKAALKPQSLPRF